MSFANVGSAIKDSYSYNLISFEIRSRSLPLCVWSKGGRNFKNQSMDCVRESNCVLVLMLNIGYASCGVSKSLTQRNNDVWFAFIYLN